MHLPMNTLAIPPNIATNDHKSWDIRIYVWVEFRQPRVLCSCIIDAGSSEPGAWQCPACSSLGITYILRVGTPQSVCYTTTAFAGIKWMSLATMVWVAGPVREDWPPVNLEQWQLWWSAGRRTSIQLPRSSLLFHILYISRASVWTIYFGQIVIATIAIVIVDCKADWLLHAATGLDIETNKEKILSLNHQ